MKKISKEQLLMTAAVAFPLIGAGAGRFLHFGSSPAQASASVNSLMANTHGSGNDAAASLAFDIPKLPGSDRDSGAIERIYRAAHQKAFDRVPLQLVPKRLAPIAQVPAPVLKQSPDERLVEAIASAKTLEFTSILSGREMLAVISGRPRRVGENVKKGWKLISINAASATVELKHDLAGKHTLQMRQHSPRDEDGRNAIEPVRQPASPK